MGNRSPLRQRNHKPAADGLEQVFRLQGAVPVTNAPVLLGVAIELECNQVETLALLDGMNLNSGHIRNYSEHLIRNPSASGVFIYSISNFFVPAASEEHVCS